LRARLYGCASFYPRDGAAHGGLPAVGSLAVGSQWWLCTNSSGSGETVIVRIGARAV